MPRTEGRILNCRHRAGPDRAARRCAADRYLGQDVRLFSGTLRDNLNLTMLERDDDRLQPRLIAGVWGRLCAKPPQGSWTLEIRTQGGGPVYRSDNLLVGRACWFARIRRSACWMNRRLKLDQRLEGTLVFANCKRMAGRQPRSSRRTVRRSLH